MLPTFDECPSPMEHSKTRGGKRGMTRGGSREEELYGVATHPTLLAPTSSTRGESQSIVHRLRTSRDADTEGIVNQVLREQRQQDFHEMSTPHKKSVRGVAASSQRVEVHGRELRRQCNTTYRVDGTAHQGSSASASPGVFFYDCKIDGIATQEPRPLFSAADEEGLGSYNHRSNASTHANTNNSTTAVQSSRTPRPTTVVQSPIDRHRSPSPLGKQWQELHHAMAPTPYVPTVASTCNVVPSTGPSDLSAAMQLLRVALCHLRATDALPHIIDLRYMEDHIIVAVSPDALFKRKVQTTLGMSGFLQPEHQPPPIMTSISHGGAKLSGGGDDRVAAFAAASKVIGTNVDDVEAFVPVTFVKVYAQLAQRRQLSTPDGQQLVVHSFAPCDADDKDIVVAFSVPSLNQIPLGNNPWEPSFLEGCMYQVMTGAHTCASTTSLSKADVAINEALIDVDVRARHLRKFKGVAAPTPSPIQKYAPFDVSEEQLMNSPIHSECSSRRHSKQHAAAHPALARNGSDVTAFNHAMRQLEWGNFMLDTENVLSLCVRRMWYLSKR